MFALARAAGAAAAALALLLAPAEGRADLTPSKLKYALLSSASDSVVSGSEESVLFLEEFTLKGKPSCVLVRYSGELIGTDIDADLHVAAAYKVYIGDVEVEPYPRTHESTTSLLPQIVSFSAFACGVPAGRTRVLVTVAASDEDDRVATVYRTLEAWTERPVRRSTTPPFLASTTGKAPPNLLKAKRTFLASADETVTARIDTIDLFEESVVLNGKPSCLLVRFSADVQGNDIDANDLVSVRFEVRIGAEAPPHPNLFDLTGSGQRQIVTFSAFRCGLEPGTYDVRVQAESADDDDPVDFNARVLEIFTETGQPAPALN